MSHGRESMCQRAELEKIKHQTGAHGVNKTAEVVVGVIADSSFKTTSE